MILTSIIIFALLVIYGGSLTTAILSPLAAQSGCILSTTVGRVREPTAIIHGRSLPTWVRANLPLSRTIPIRALCGPAECQTSLMEGVERAMWRGTILPRTQPLEAGMAPIADNGLDRHELLKFTII